MNDNEQKKKAQLENDQLNNLPKAIAGPPRDVNEQKKKAQLENDQLNDLSKEIAGPQGSGSLAFLKKQIIMRRNKSNQKKIERHAGSDDENESSSDESSSEDEPSQKRVNILPSQGPKSEEVIINLQKKYNVRFKQDLQEFFSDGVCSLNSEQYSKALASLESFSTYYGDATEIQKGKEMVFLFKNGGVFLRSGSKDINFDPGKKYQAGLSPVNLEAYIKKRFSDEQNKDDLNKILTVICQLGGIQKSNLGDTNKFLDGLADKIQSKNGDFLEGSLNFCLEKALELDTVLMKKENAKPVVDFKENDQIQSESFNLIDQKDEVPLKKVSFLPSQERKNEALNQFIRKQSNVDVLREPLLQRKNIMAGRGGPSKKSSSGSDSQSSDDGDRY